ncbi:MAG: hypothetical protein U0R19_32490 [Bryobacteraceae bacterium]
MNRRNFLPLLTAPALVAKTKRPEIVNAHYFRAHMYTMVPRHVREDLAWMAGAGCTHLTLAVLEQDLFAAVENIEIVCNEAAKRNLKVIATPARWGGLTAGAPKVPSLFSALHPETWILNEDGSTYQAPRVSGVISSIHHPATYEFFCQSLSTLFTKFPIDGMIWDEPKGFRLDYSKAAVAKLGAKAPREAHWQATADFYGRVSQFVRGKFPTKRIAMFVQAHNNMQQVEICARIEGIDTFGCDGRPWDLATDKQWATGAKQEDQESGKGKVLLGKGEQITALARKHGKKALMLAENHNLPAVMLPAMEQGLPKVLALPLDHLLFYYYPRNIADPDRNMAIIAAALKSAW